MATTEDAVARVVDAAPVTFRSSLDEIYLLHIPCAFKDLAERPYLLLHEIQKLNSHALTGCDLLDVHHEAANVTMRFRFLSPESLRNTLEQQPLHAFGRDWTLYPAHKQPPPRGAASSNVGREGKGSDASPTPVCPDSIDGSCLLDAAAAATSVVEIVDVKLNPTSPPKESPKERKKKQKRSDSPPAAARRTRSGRTSRNTAACEETEAPSIRRSKQLSPTPVGLRGRRSESRSSDDPSDAPQEAPRKSGSERKRKLEDDDRRDIVYVTTAKHPHAESRLILVAPALMEYVPPELMATYCSLAAGNEVSVVVEDVATHVRATGSGVVSLVPEYGRVTVGYTVLNGRSLEGQVAHITLPDNGFRLVSLRTKHDDENGTNSQQQH